MILFVTCLLSLVNFSYCKIETLGDEFFLLFTSYDTPFALSITSTCYFALGLFALGALTFPFTRSRFKDSRANAVTLNPHCDFWTSLILMATGTMTFVVTGIYWGAGGGLYWDYRTCKGRFENTEMVTTFWNVSRIGERGCFITSS